MNSLAERERTAYAEERKAAPILWIGMDGRLWCGVGEDARAVTVLRCFPWSEPGRFISLRDDKDEEFALVADAAELDAESRAALEVALAEAGFLIEVTGLVEVEEEVEIRHWTVVTKGGRRTFQTRLDDWPRPLPSGGWLIRDVAGDLYRVPPLEGLDAGSRGVFWPYVD